jgi:hypothetical protein
MGVSVFIGHFVPAEILQDLAPTTPRWVALTGVSFPDLLWGVTILTGLEKVEIDPDSPLQKSIRFVKYPFSHSLVLTNLIACIPALIIGYLLGPVAGIVFVAASVSHWVLDTIMHLPDLPILGFDGDRKVGLGLWRNGAVAFVVEYLFLAVGTLLYVPRASWAYVLVVGFLLHLVNLNSFFGLTKRNPIKSGRVYAIFAMVGFVAAILLFNGAF